MQRLLVVGARERSLGAAIASAGTDNGYDVVTAGLSKEDFFLDVLKTGSARRMFCGLGQVDHVICSAGINTEGNAAGDLLEQLQVNCVGHALVLGAWMRSFSMDEVVRSGGPRHWISISSNSAHRPRSRSAGYCASKAALSMYMRSVAREVKDNNLSISVVEPGWIEGTQMSQQVSSRLGLEDKGIDSGKLAAIIVGCLTNGMEWNGVSLRLDNGEI